MEIKTTLKGILLVSIVGMLFSGYLTLTKLLTGTCALGTCEYLVGIPTCVYGFIMYMIIFLISVFGLMSKPKIEPKVGE